MYEASEANGMTVTLKLQENPDLPVEAESIVPFEFARKSLKEIRLLPAYQGNQSLTLGDFFEITGRAGKDTDSTDIVVTGDLRNIKRIGQGMNGGRVSVEGNVGMYLGAEMIAGRIHVNGSVDAWAAAEMKGGNIQIEGDAGDYLCAGYRGSWEGMTGGRVYIAGSVGREMASHMRKGFIAVKGDVGSPAAVRMMGGTIIVVGNLGERVGVQATRGMIICLGRMDSVLPTYKFSGNSEREFIQYYLRYLCDRRPDFLDEEMYASEKWTKFLGDFAEAATGEELYLRQSRNEHLLAR